MTPGDMWVWPSSGCTMKHSSVSRCDTGYRGGRGDPRCSCMGWRRGGGLIDSVGGASVCIGSLTNHEQ